VKRGLDIALAAVGLCLLAIPMAAIAVWVRNGSAGPAFFVQQRLGRYGNTFGILKFRTMTTDGAAWESNNHITVGDDPRITAAGRVLRRYKLDELPQLLNVLRGDMSLVGPRPEVPQYLEYYTPEQRETVFSVRPGITDPVSLHLSDEASLLAAADDPLNYYAHVILPWKIAGQIAYIERRSTWTDMAIIGRTIVRALGYTLGDNDDIPATPKRAS